MVLLEKLWDDVLAGPQPERGLGRLRKVSAKPIVVPKVGGDAGGVVGESSSGSGSFQRSISMPATPTTPVTPTTPSPTSARKDNVWRSVFHPGSNIATRSIGNNIFDKPQPNSPTVYDWLYSGETRTRSNHR